MAISGIKTVDGVVKPTFPIYFALVTDGPVPGRHNLLHVTAEYNRDLRWARNVLPQTPYIQRGARLTEELIQQMSVDARPICEVMRELAQWLERFKGRRLPVTSALAFWHLVHHMSEVVSPLPFVSNPIDVNSFYAGSRGRLGAARPVRGKDPSAALAQRREIVEEICMIGEVRKGQYGS